MQLDSMIILSNPSAKHLVLEAAVGQGGAGWVGTHVLQEAQKLLAHAPIPDGVGAAHAAGELAQQGPGVHVRQLLCQAGREEARQRPCCRAVGWGGQGPREHPHQPGEHPHSQHGMVIFGGLQPQTDSLKVENFWSLERLLEKQGTNSSPAAVLLCSKATGSRRIPNNQARVPGM